MDTNLTVVLFSDVIVRWVLKGKKLNSVGKVKLNFSYLHNSPYELDSLKILPSLPEWNLGQEKSWLSMPYTNRIHFHWHPYHNSIRFIKNQGLIFLPIIDENIAVQS